MDQVALKLDWATHASARMACEQWHYSKSLPMPPLVRVGVWENGVFVGVVLFSRGASPGLLRPYGLTQTEGCELTRAAFRSHATPMSRILALAMRFLKKRCPTLRLIVSFADPAQNHHGGIYAAGGWVYTGQSKAENQYHNGSRWLHRREAVGLVAFGQAKKAFDWRSAPTRLTPGKHRYLFPLDTEMRARIAPLAKPYPKRAGSADSGTAGIQPEGGGATPTPALTSTGGAQ